MKISRRDFLKKMKDIGIGIGIVSLVPNIKVPEPEPEWLEIEGVTEEFMPLSLYSSTDGLTGGAGPSPLYLTMTDKDGNEDTSLVAEDWSPYPRTGTSLDLPKQGERRRW